MCPLWLIFGKAALRFMGMLTILMHVPRRRSGARFGDGLSAVVWSLSESCWREDEPLERVRRVMDTPVYRVPLQFEQFMMTLLYRVILVSWRSVLAAAVGACVDILVQASSNTS